MHYYQTIDSPIGKLTITTDGTYVTGIFHYETDVFEQFGKAFPAKDEPLIEATHQWLDRYFALNKPDKTLPIRLDGTDFQMEVWHILQTIPYGETMTYGQIAQQIAAKRGLRHFSAQAVGGAIGKNPLSIYIPCHRVVGANHRLTGYHGGLERKEKLLRLEKSL